MLRTIMTTEVEYDLLQEAGVSAEGIDFVSQLLRTDPHDRPNEKQLFKHPWIADVADIDEYSDAENSAIEEEEQLPLIVEAVEDELDASQLSINDNLEDKEAFYAEAEPGASQLKRPRLTEEVEVRYPSLPSLKSFPVVDVPFSAAPHQRLFGEVTPSALRSSGIFEGLGPSAFSFGSSQSSGESMDGVDTADSLAAAVHSFPESRLGGSSPGVWGVNSPMGPLQRSASDSESLRFGFQAPDTPGTPRSRAEREGTPANGDLADPAKNSPNAHEITPKALPIHRRVDLPLPDTASESSNTRDDDSFKIHKLRENNADLDELATTIDARTGKEISAEIPATITHRDASEEPTGVATTIPRALPLTTFAKPLPLLGKLVSVPGSAIDLTLRLESRMTSWGRGPYATVVHPDRNDTRIPAYAIEVTFWSPGIEARIAEGTDWMDIPDVMTILSTKTRKCIWVNGVELRRAPEAANGRQAIHFGKLYTDDVITIFENGDKYLRFRCEFYHGDSAGRRPTSEPGFTVRQVLETKNDAKQNQLANSKRDTRDDKVYA